MTETVFAGKEIKEFPGDQVMRPLATPFAIAGKITENFFMRYRPGYTGNRNGQNK
jgi:hypothetical protein